MQRRDQVGLRLHDFRAVDLEQRIARLTTSPILAITRVTRPVNGVATGAGVLIEGNLADRDLVDTKLV